MTGLTNTRRELLVAVRDEGATGYICASWYKPAKALVDLGLCEFITGKYGATRLHITPDGRAWLAINKVAK